MSPRVFLCLNQQERSDATLLSLIFRSNKKEAHQISVRDDAKAVTLVTKDATGLSQSTDFAFDRVRLFDFFMDSRRFPPRLSFLFPFFLQVFHEFTPLKSVYNDTAHDLVAHFFLENGEFMNGCFIIFGSVRGEAFVSLFILLS